MIGSSSGCDCDCDCAVVGALMTVMSSAMFTIIYNKHYGMYFVATLQYRLLTTDATGTVLPISMILLPVSIRRKRCNTVQNNTISYKNTTKVP